MLAYFFLLIMIKLFKYNQDNYSVDIEPEALMLKPFKKIYESEKDKEFVKQIFAFIYFFADPRSDYQYIIDKSSRIEAIKQGLGLKSIWKPNEDIEEAIAFYESFKPVSAMLLEDTRFAVDKLRQALKEIDFSQVDDKGKPIYPLNTLTSTIKLIPTLVKDLNEAEKALNSEIRSNAKARGGQEKTLFDDGINL